MSMHFYVVSGTAIAAALASVLIIGLTRSLRETRLLFLGLGFLSIAGIFSVHGLLTPGHIHDDFYASLPFSSWFSIFVAAVFVALSVASLPPVAEAWLKRFGPLLFSLTAFALGLYVGLSLVVDEWLDWVPYDNRMMQLGVTALTIPVLGFSAWRYYQAFLFARLPSQWAMVVAMVLLIAVQVSMTWGRYWSYSWWLYHVSYGMAFVTIFVGWFLEARRAGSLTVIAEALSMRDAIAQLNQGYEDPVADLIDQIEWKDLYTHGHVRRVAGYALMIGKEMGLSPLELRALALGAQMHDVGKLGVPDRILTKPGPLTPAEFEVIKQHVARGYEIASRVVSLQPVADAIRHHHERWDGTGYPDCLAGENIPLHARIVSVADAFDAMTSGRVYQKAISESAAIEELKRGSGSHFDPACVKGFAAAMKRVEDPVAKLAALPSSVDAMSA